MRRSLPTIIFVVTAILVLIGTMFPAKQPNLSWMGGSETTLGSSGRSTPDAAMRTFLDKLRGRDWHGAYALLANQNEIKESRFAAEMDGTNQDLRNHSTLQASTAKILNQNGDEATAEADLNWTSVVGAFTETRDFKLQKKGSDWAVVWPVTQQANVPPQVIPVNYLRWDVIYRGANDDWGAQDAEQPHVRIVAMNPIQHDKDVVVLGELLNEDTVPAFVNVGARLLGKDGKALDAEVSFDKMSHTILPKQVTPFRIDFPNMKLDQVDKIDMQPHALLVSASADPVISVQDQKLTGDSGGRVLSGSLVNQSGQTVSIPHVLATFYDRQGQIVWVADGYTESALQPQIPVNFSIKVPANVNTQIASYRVIVSPWSEQTR